ncbi:hypothetical protein SEA_ATUIN_90 [Arthrobacter phage Atuin]|nr:hypothetical protein SEA_ATUIN_189 [Arthrobacter phage Atuin]
MASELYKTAKLISDYKFILLVEAAMLKHAQTVDLTVAGNSKNLAIYVLKNPMLPEGSMIALVASDPTVLGAATMNGDSVVVDAVPDSAIQNAVAAKWSTVATKFTNTTSTSGAPAAA